MGNEQQPQGAGTETVATTAVETTRTVDAQTTTPANAAPSAERSPGAELGKVRDLVLKAHPDVVPDLVRGNSVDELISSVEPARTAYQRIADQVREGRGVAGSQGGGVNEGGGVVGWQGGREGEGDPAGAGTAARAGTTGPPATPRPRDPATPVQPPLVPAGGGSNVADPAELGPTTKIAQALAARKRRG